MLNEITLMGRIVHTPEVKTTNSGLSVCSFSIACERDFADQSTGKRETDFFDIVAWRSTADFVGKYFSKGDTIAVAGRLQTRKYTANNGSNRVATEVVAERVYFGGTKKAKSDTEAPAEKSASKRNPVDIRDDDIDDDPPF